MNGLLKILFVIFFFAFISEFITRALQFLGFTFEEYAPYLFWFYILIILIAILPESRSNLFSKK